MFHFTVTSSDVNFRYFIFGGLNGQESIRFGGERLGPQSARYIIGVAGKGYMTVTDVGNSVSGPGDWAVHVTGSADHWFYKGEGQGKITFTGDTYVIDGGANTIHGRLTPWA